MLSLSIFSSSQRISVALYEGKLLKKFFEKIINGKQNDSIFLLINKVLNKKMNISNIFFSVGPGSFTALRAIKAIAQAIAFSHKAKIISVTEFEIYLSCFKNYENDILVFYENSKAESKISKKFNHLNKHAKFCCKFIYSNS